MKLGSLIMALPLVAVLAVAAVKAQETSADPYQELAKYQATQNRLPLAAIEEQIRKTSPSGYKEIEAKFLALLKSPNTTKDAKRFMCRWLAVVGSSACIPAVAELLSDEDLSHMARWALESKADPAAGAALRAALPKVKGKLLAGLISSIGIRRDTEAVGALVELAGDPDPLVSGAAVAALGEIGTEEAVKGLESLKVPPALVRTLARARITAAGRLAATGRSPQAANLYQSLMQPQQPREIRTAALKGLIATLSKGEAVKLISDLVQGEDAALRTAAISAYLSTTDKALKDAVAEHLPTMKPAGKILLLGVLADQAEVVVRPAVLKILVSAEKVDIRRAAMECLAQHGEAADVPLVVQLALAKTDDLADSARKVLQRMSKPGVNEALAKLIESPKSEERAVVLAALANRRVESALPVLQRLLTGSDEGLAAEAAKALAVMGKTEQLTPLGNVLTQTTNQELREVAREAVRTICNRAIDKQAAARALLESLEKAQTPPARVALLQLLLFTRGEEALKAVRQATKEDDTAVREAAVRTLVAWPEATAVPYLFELAKVAPDSNHAVLALRDGCLRLANLRDLPTAQRFEIYRRVLETARNAEVKKQALAGLSRLPSLEALVLLRSCLKDSDLSKEAAPATIRLARQLGAVYNKQALAALEEVKAQAGSAGIRKQVEEAIEAVQKSGQSPEGYIVAWVLSGPYTQEGKNGSDLFDQAFAPEKPGSRAGWGPLTLAPDGKPGMVDLDKALGGNDRVAYLKTQITSAKDQDAMLLIGSDDGVKVWLNGQVVHANNAIRPNTPDQDRTKIKLKKGTNTLMLKVTQGGGEWTVCCRLRSFEGKELEGVSIAPE